MIASTTTHFHRSIFFATTSVITPAAESVLFDKAFLFHSILTTICNRLLFLPIQTRNHHVVVQEKDQHTCHITGGGASVGTIFFLLYSGRCLCTSTISDYRNSKSKQQDESPSNSHLLASVFGRQSSSQRVLSRRRVQIVLSIGENRCRQSFPYGYEACLEVKKWRRLRK